MAGAVVPEVVACVGGQTALRLDNPGIQILPLGELGSLCTSTFRMSKLQLVTEPPSESYSENKLS